jgi:hypothetical protein
MLEGDAKICGRVIVVPEEERNSLSQYFNLMSSRPNDKTGFDHRKFFPALIICSEYKFQFESGLHHTDAWYFITRIGEVPCNCARMITQNNLIDRYSRDEAESPAPPYTLGVEFPSDAIKSTDLFLYRESLDDIVID